MSKCGAALRRPLSPFSDLFPFDIRSSHCGTMITSQEACMRNVKVLFSEEVLHERVEALGREIAGCGVERPLIVPVLTGSFIFAADLVRALHHAGMPTDIDFMALSSYGSDTVSSGQVRVLKDLSVDVEGRDVIIVDDILESGRTLKAARDLVIERKARSVRIAVLLEKPGKQAVTIDADFTGFECPDVFVVGYGIDWADAYRALPYVGSVEEA